MVFSILSFQEIHQLQLPNKTELDKAYKEVYPGQKVVVNGEVKTVTTITANTVTIS